MIVEYDGDAGFCDACLASFVDEILRSMIILANHINEI